MKLQTVRFASKLLFVAAMWASFACAQAAPPATNVGLPIVFVHGWCGDATTWDAALAQVRTTLQTNFPSLYPNAQTYVNFYDGKTANFQVEGSTTVSKRIPADARFFEVALFDPWASPRIYQNFDVGRVARLPIFEKGDELAHLIWNVKAQTGTPRVVVVSHSMGGLDIRSYIEQLAQGAAPNGIDSYENDIATMITLDTPHAGAHLADVLGPENYSSDSGFSCFLTNNTNKQELSPESPTVHTLNYDSSFPGATPIPAGLNLMDWKTYWTCCTTFPPPFPNTNSDNITTKDEQDLNLALSGAPAGSNNSNTVVIENSVNKRLGQCGQFLHLDQPLHILDCLALANTTFSDVSDEVSNTAAMTNNVTVTPKKITLAPGGTTTFQASTQDGGTAIWSVLQGDSCGSIGQDGTYTAPQHAGTCYVVAIDSTSPGYGAAIVTIGN